MDGLSERGRILIIATTNCPDFIDPAILRPGRIDRQIFMGPPDKTGRAALFSKLLSRMPVAEDISEDKLVALTEGLSGAQIEHIINEAGLLAVKEAIVSNTPADSVQVSTMYFQQAIGSFKNHIKPSSSVVRLKTQT